MIDKNTTLRIDRARIQFERFDDETVMINVENGLYYSTSQSGSEVLRLVDSGCPAGMLVVALLGNSEEAEHYTSGIIRFVEELISEGILVECNPHSSAGRPIDIHSPVYSQTGAFQPPFLERFDEVQDLLLIDPIHMVDPKEGWPKI
jgi:hypothetical protein